MPQNRNSYCGEKMSKYVEDLIVRTPSLEAMRPSLNAAVDLIVSAFHGGNKVLTCGNGGSAADAEHIVGELMKGFLLQRRVSDAQEQQLLSGGCPGELIAHLQQGVPAISLVAGVSLPTAFANDVSAKAVFAQQVFALGKKGDVLIAISTSGNSGNVIAAVHVAKALGIKCIGLTGGKKSLLADMANVCIAVPATEVVRVQELHLPVYHAICADVEDSLFNTI